MANRPLADKRVLLTGAAHGLGRAMALGLIGAGARLVITDRDGAALNAVAGGQGATAGQVVVHSADLTRPQEIPGIVGAAERAFGGIDVLINNAGISVNSVRQDYWNDPVRVWDADIDAYRKFFDTNVLAAIDLTLRLLPGMRARKWGRIISNSTSLNTMIAAGMGPYGCTKAALEAFTASLAADLAGSGVTANVILPGGPADTRMVPAAVPRHELVPADCLVAPALWLCSDAADGVTGRRFLGARWDRAAPPVQAAEGAGAPIAWTGFGAAATVPKSSARTQ